jgi:hypothetical protein
MTVTDIVGNIIVFREEIVPWMIASTILSAHAAHYARSFTLRNFLLQNLVVSINLQSLKVKLANTFIYLKIY